MLFTKLTGKKLVFSASLLAVFLFLLALPFGAFLVTPLPGILNKGTVLSAKSSDFGGYLTLGSQSKPLFMREVWATAFGGKTATYDNVLTVQNTFGVVKTFKLQTISESALGQNIATWAFKNGQSAIKLRPLEESEVNLVLSNQASSEAESRVHFWILVIANNE